MSHERSRTRLPAVAAITAVLVGTFTMGLAALVARQLGLRLTLIVSELLLLAPAVLAVALFRVAPSTAFGWRPIDGRTAWLSLLAGLTFWGGSLGLFELQYSVWRPPEGYLEMFQRLHEALQPEGPIDAVLSVVAIAVGPAVCEELLFRGVVLGSFVPRLGRWGAVIGSALAFSLIHVDASPAGPSLYRVPFAFAVGLGLGAVRVRSGSILAAILAHAVLNAVTFLVAPLTEPPGSELPDAQPAFGAILLGAAIAASFWLLRRIDAPTNPT